MRVLHLDLQAQYASLRGEVEEAILGVLASQRFILGSQVEALEQEIAAYTGVRHAVACASGTDALLLALMALDVSPGDEVITTPFTFFATAGSIHRMRARPVFVDIEPDSFNLDPEGLAPRITPRTRAILPIQMFGRVARMEEILETAGRYGLPVVEDAAQALGARCDGRMAGTMGRLGCYSFYPTKNLGGAGDGGMVVTNDSGLAARLRRLRNHGSDDRYHHAEVGLNSRLDEIQAAVLRVKLKRLERWNRARRRLAALYTRLLGDAVLTPALGPEGSHIYHQYAIRTADRDGLRKRLAERGVETPVYYPLPLHLQKCFDYLGYEAGDFPQAEAASREVLSLPLYPELTGEAGVGVGCRSRRERMISVPETPTAADLDYGRLLEEKIRRREARVGVVGLGYVGLPLAVELARAGFTVTGIDTDPKKVTQIRAGQCYVADVEAELLRSLVEARKLAATSDYSAVAQLDTINICVPTPLRKSKDPDMSYVVHAAEEVARYLHPGMIVILESTTYPGTTEELILPLLERGGLKVGRDFFLCFSPERVDPGNQQFQTRNIPKVVGGVTPRSTEIAALLYSHAIERVVSVSSPRVAEMVKLLENTFRMINIGLANEMALLCDRMGINVWEVIEAAATKPFGFMPFYPGPGLGGHCIPIDPFYLSWKSKQAGAEARFIELAGQINGQMPLFVVEKVQAALNERSKPVKGSRIHIVGVSYKRNVDDIRESPALDIIALLEKRGAQISYTDPYIPQLRWDDGCLSSEDLEEAAARADCVILVTDHSQVDYARLVELAPLIVDTRNVLKSFASNKIVRL
ncbi:MAG: nucleotide sugar dehydrogenase [Acidobacteria bacterium]|nr:nucleotide sugar dehydrogenase [Acidobacteriota bacterium]